MTHSSIGINLHEYMNKYLTRFNKIAIQGTPQRGGEGRGEERRGEERRGGEGRGGEGGGGEGRGGEDGRLYIL